MPINSRNKGATFEREVCRLLSEGLGPSIDYGFKRNLEQSRSGGCDIVPDKEGVNFPVAIECKRHATVTDAQVRQWWRQTWAQANDAKMIPALVYKGNLQPIRVRLGVDDFMRPEDMGWGYRLTRTMDVDWDTFIEILDWEYLTR